MVVVVMIAGFLSIDQLTDPEKSRGILLIRYSLIHTL